MVFIVFSLSSVERLWGVYCKPFPVSDFNHQGKSGTGSLFLFVIKHLIFCVSCYLICLDKLKLGNSLVIPEGLVLL